MIYFFVVAFLLFVVFVKQIRKDDDFLVLENHKDRLIDCWNDYGVDLHSFYPFELKTNDGRQVEGNFTAANYQGFYKNKFCSIFSTSKFQRFISTLNINNIAFCQILKRESDGKIFNFVQLISSKDEDVRFVFEYFSKSNYPFILTGYFDKTLEVEKYFYKSRFHITPGVFVVSKSLYNHVQIKIVLGKLIIVNLFNKQFTWRNGISKLFQKTLFRLSSSG